jgi:alpha-glucosidase
MSSFATTAPILLAVPHHDGSGFDVSNPAPALGERVSVLLRTPAGPDAEPVDRVWVRTTPDGDPVHVPAQVDRRTAHEVWWRADVTVRNPVTRYRFLIESPHRLRWCTAAGTAVHDGPDATDFTLLADFPAPAWTGDAVVYQVFPDRFARSSAAADRPQPGWAVPAGWDEPVIGRGPLTPRQVYGGDLDGVRERLDHIAALGANALYLTPIVTAESNHRYNASSFTEVDPLLGGNAAYARLCAAVHERGWRIVGDLTLNHIGDGHPWFRTARDDPAAAERSMFYFDADTAHGYEAWGDVASLPKLNWASPQLRRQLIDGPDAVVRRWLHPPYEQDGWRVDVANMVGRRGADDHTAAVVATLRQALAATGRDRVLIAEHSHDASADLARCGWHGTMNYAGFTQSVWSWLRGPDAAFPLLGLPVPLPRLPGATAMAIMRGFAAATPRIRWDRSWSLLGSHDTARIASVVAGTGCDEVAIGLLCTLPGTPMIFAGDEIGLHGGWGEDARRPMPWDRPDSWDRATLQHYRALIALRHAHRCLREGAHRWVHLADDVLVYLRETTGQRMLVLAARAPHQPVALPAAPLGLAAGSAANVHGGAADLPSSDTEIVLPGDGPTFQVWQLPGETR